MTVQSQTVMPGCRAPTLRCPIRRRPPCSPEPSIPTAMADSGRVAKADSSQHRVSNRRSMARSPGALTLSNQGFNRPTYRGCILRRQRSYVRIVSGPPIFSVGYPTFPPSLGRFVAIGSADGQQDRPFRRPPVIRLHPLRIVGNHPRRWATNRCHAPRLCGLARPPSPIRIPSFDPFAASSRR